MMEHNLFRKVNKTQSQKLPKYENLGFHRNPFPRHPGVNINDPDNRQNGSIYLRELRSSEEQQFEKILIPSENKTETKTIAFLMDYATRKGRGIGKTAFLNYQRNRIMNDLGHELSNGSDVLFAVYVAPRPNDNYRKFYNISKLILFSIIDQEIISLAMCRIRVFTELIDDRVLSQVGDSLINTIGDDEWLREKHRELKIDISIHDLNQRVKRVLEGLSLDSDLVNTLHRFGYVSTDILNYFFDKKPEFYWKSKASILLFDDFVKIFEAAGFTNGIILLEELEKIIVPQTSLARLEFCQAMRYYFIDGDSSHNTHSSFYKILLTIHPYLQELLYPHWESSGLGRFAGLSQETSDDFTVYFNPIDSPQAVPLAKAYLKESRIDGDQDNLTPFSEDALSLALQKTLGVPGKYLAFLHSAVERAISDGWTKIEIPQINQITLPDAPLDNQDEADESLGDTTVDLNK
jgi:hypothetical protein